MPNGTAGPRVEKMDINLPSHRFYFPQIYCADPGAQPQLTEFKVR